MEINPEKFFVLQALYNIKQRRSQGICSLVHEWMHYSDVPGEVDQDNVLLKLFYKWPELNGAPVFYLIEGSHEAFQLNGDKWNPHTVYGQRRLNLYNWLIEQLEEDLYAI